MTSLRDPDRALSFGTQQIHAGQSFCKATRAVTVPIVASNAFVFPDPLPEGAPESTEPSWVYSRISNPTLSVFEDRMTKLEGGVGSVATATGQAATLLAILSLARCGDNFVVSTQLYGGSYKQFDDFFPRMGITAKWVSTSDPADFENAIDERTKGVFVESISNPSLQVFDIAALASVARKHGVPLIVDNTFGGGGYLIRPIELGADVVLHSATKWIGGHGTTMGGIIVTSGKLPFADNPRFPEFNQTLPGYDGIVVVKECGEMAHAFKIRMETLRDSGACLSAPAAFQLLQGLETLSIRMRVHCANALALAHALERNPHVAWVSYPGLASHSSHALAQEILPRGSGGMLTFGLKGVDGKAPEAVAAAFIAATKLCYHAPNVGDVRTLVAHPASTTQSQLSEEDRKLNGTPQDLIRVSVGIEESPDIIYDFEQAIATVFPGPEPTAVKQDSPAV